ncbi:hypothetical protein D3C83_149350 [compost metagenome]
MREAGVVPLAHARILIIKGQLESLVVLQEPKAHEEWRKDGLRPPELLEEKRA